MKFVDYVTISVRSGKGGGGAVSFRREKYNPHGGPDGGNGGKGGSVILEGDKQLYTLLDLRYNRHHFAEAGASGGSRNKSGSDGEDIVLRVPIGTIAKDKDKGTVIGEIGEHGQQLHLAKGGRGGKGNEFFKTATRQTPKYSQPGEDSEELDVILELKLLADVGLVGFPNAGKSTLVAAISAAKPKIADYPFTTLKPALGVVQVGDYKSFVIADIPGIIKGAHEGKGLGIQFLKHIERNAVLLFVIPVTDNDPVGSYNVLLQELTAFNEKLLLKPRMIVLAKIDLMTEEDIEVLLQLFRDELEDDVEILPISSVAHKGLDRLRNDLWDRLEDMRDL
ncbi:MAG: GTPase ObgE [Rhodothermales bacterium]